MMKKRGKNPEKSFSPVIIERGMTIKDFFLGSLTITLIVLIVISITKKDYISLVISIINLLITIIIYIIIEKEKRKELKEIEKGSKSKKK